MIDPYQTTYCHFYPEQIPEITEQLNSVGWKVIVLPKSNIIGMVALKCLYMGYVGYSDSRLDFK